MNTFRTLALIVILATPVVAHDTWPARTPSLFPRQVTMPVTTQQTFRLAGVDYHQRHAPIATAWAKFWKAGRYVPRYEPIERVQPQPPKTCKPMAIPQPVPLNAIQIRLERVQ